MSGADLKTAIREYEIAVSDLRKVERRFISLREASDNAFIEFLRVAAKGEVTGVDLQRAGLDYQRLHIEAEDTYKQVEDAVNYRNRVERHASELAEPVLRELLE